MTCSESEPQALCPRGTGEDTAPGKVAMEVKAASLISSRRGGSERGRGHQPGPSGQLAKYTLTLMSLSWPPHCSVPHRRAPVQPKQLSPSPATPTGYSPPSSQSDLKTDRLKVPMASSHSTYKKFQSPLRALPPDLAPPSLSGFCPRSDSSFTSPAHQPLRLLPTPALAVLSAHFSFFRPSPGCLPLTIHASAQMSPIGRALS